MGWQFWVLITVGFVFAKLFGLLGVLVVWGAWYLISLVIKKTGNK